MKVGRRTTLLIEPYKQLRFGLMFLGLNVLFTLLIVGVSSYYMWDMFEAIHAYFAMTGAETMMSLEKFARPAFLIVFLGCLFIACTLYLSARYTHQIYGPMVSIKRFLDQIIAGDKPSPISLRKNDQLQDLVERLNTIAKMHKYQEKKESKSDVD